MGHCTMYRTGHHGVKTTGDCGTDGGTAPLHHTTQFPDPKLHSQNKHYSDGCRSSGGFIWHVRRQVSTRPSKHPPEF
uniref:Uncharacterized protein n=1 Tax=Anguilla anguilla TaxID=7936 RepID=A0A0E9WJA4_ANGAN